MKLTDIIARLTSLKTTVMAIVGALLTILVAGKVVSEDALTVGLTETGNIYDAVLVLLGSGVSIALLFSKDSEVIEKELTE